MVPSPVRILHTIYDDVDNPWCGGGGAVRALEVNRRLSARHDVLQVTGNYPGAAAEVEKEGVRLLRLGSDRSYALSRLSFSAMASAFLLRHPFDIWVYDFSAFSPVFAPPPIARRSVLILHHLMLQHAARKRPVAGVLARAAERLTCRRHLNTITVSQSTAEGLRRYNRSAHVDIIRNGVELPGCNPPRREGDYLLYFGRLDLYTKGIDLLLQAFSRVHDRHPNIRLVIAGRASSDSLRAAGALCESLGIDKAVDLRGAVPDEEKWRLLSGALFVCLPSRYEGWGIVAIEANAVGKPVVGTRIPGLVEAVVDGQTGLLVTPENPEALAGAMSQLIDDRGLRTRLGQAGERRAGGMTWEAVADEQQAVYTDLLSCGFA